MAMFLNACAVSSLFFEELCFLMWIIPQADINHRNNESIGLYVAGQSKSCICDVALYFFWSLWFCMMSFFPPHFMFSNVGYMVFGFIRQNLQHTSMWEVRFANTVPSTISTLSMHASTMFMQCMPSVAILNYWKNLKKKEIRWLNCMESETLVINLSVSSKRCREHKARVAL